MKRKSWKSYLSIGTNDDGFTLLEVMVAISLLSLGVLLLSNFVEQSSRIQQEIKADRQIEWHLFLNQIEYDLREGQLIHMSSERIVVERPSEDGKTERITYERYYKLIRRRLGGVGHQPVLTQLKEIHMENNTGQIWISATFQNGESYTAGLALPLKEDEEQVSNEK